MKCGKKVYVVGGFFYTLRVARDAYKCFHCDRIIQPGALYVEERSIGGILRRYHAECFNKVTPHRLKVVECPSGVKICVY